MKNISKIDIPISDKYNLTVREAAAISNLGINRIEELLKNPMCSFVLHVGNRKKLVKRKEFERFLEKSIEI